MDGTMLKKRIHKKGICIFLTIVAVIAIALFAAYKIFVTPSMVAMLSAYNSAKGLIKSVEYISEDDELRTMAEIIAGKGKTEIELTAYSAPALSGTSADITVNSDGKKTISEIEFNRFLKFDMYRDDKEFLMNIPMLPNGLRVSFSDMEAGKNPNVGSIQLKPNSYGAKTAAAMYGAAIAGDLYDDNDDDIISVVEGIEFKKTGTDKVKIGDKTKTAGVYLAHISERQTERIGKIILNHIKSSGCGSFIENAVTERVEELKGGYDLTFKIRGFKVREIVIKSEDGKVRTVKLEGEKNPSDDMSYYADNNSAEAVRRVHSQNSDTIYHGGKPVFSVSDNDGQIALSTDIFGCGISVRAWGVKESDGTVLIKSIDININNTVKLNGSAKLSEEYDRSMTFDRAEEYVDILDTDSKEWQRITDIIIGEIGLVTGKK